MSENSKTGRRGQSKATADRKRASEMKSKRIAVLESRDAMAGEWASLPRPPRDDSSG